MQVLGGCYAHKLACRCISPLHAQHSPLSARSSLQVSPGQIPGTQKRSLSERRALQRSMMMSLGNMC